MRKLLIGAALLALAARDARPTPISTSSPANPNGARWRPKSAATKSPSTPPPPAPRTRTRSKRGPSLIARARNADITVCTGAELEIGWLPMIVQQSGNPKIAAGPAGRVRRHRAPCICWNCPRASTARKATSTPPAIRTSRPIRATCSRWRKPLADRFAQLDPANAATYHSALGRFRASAGTRRSRNGRRRPRRCKGVPIAVQHHALDLSWRTGSACSEVVPLEPKPGVPPSSGYLAQVLQKLQTHAGEVRDPRRL